MITSFVLTAFDRLASDAILDIARSATPSPPPSLVDSFMDEAFRLDGKMRSAYEGAKAADAADPPTGDESSREEMFRHVFEQILEGIANGGTSSAKAVSEGNITHLMNMIRFLHQKQEGGEDRERKSVGFREKLQGFREGLSRSGTRESTAKEIVEFVQDAFSGEMDWLTNRYLWSRQRGGDLKTNLLAQDTGSKEKGRKQAEMTVFGMLLEGTRNSIEKELYRNHPTDERALGAIVSGVWHRIKNRETGDKYDGETAATGGGKYSRTMWGRYIAPLQDTGKFGQGESLDILGITEFLNEHFLRRDLESGTSVDAPLPGGGTMTAPSLRTKLKSTKVRQWATGASAGVSMDAPVGEGDEGGTVGDTISAPREDTEGPFTEWLGSPAERDPSSTNRDLVREEIRGWVDEAMRRTSVLKTNKAIVRDVLLVKMGLVSSEAERAEFLDRWLKKDIPKFRAEAIDAATWKKIGEPFRKVRKGDPGYRVNPETGEAIKRRPEDEPPYSKDWEQQALVNKTTGEQFIGRTDTLKGLNQDNLEVVTKVHKAGDEAKPQHMLNWMKYNQEDRKADLEQALDVYSEKWFEQSVSEEVRQELEDSNETLAKAFRKFRPENIFKAVAKYPDAELVRAMGRVKPTVQLESGKTPFEVHPAIYPDIKKAIKRIGDVMVEESEKDDSALRYLSLKREGRVASRIDIESIILETAAALAEPRDRTPSRSRPPGSHTC